MKYQKKQEWKKKLIGMMALLMAMILVLSMLVPFTTFAAEATMVGVTNTTTAKTSISDEEAIDAGEKEERIGTDQFRLEAEAGFDGNYIVDGYLPVRGVITALDGGFQGQLQIKSYIRNMDSNKEYAEYYQELELGQGASKTIDMEVGLSNIQRNLEVSLVDTKGNVVFRDYIGVKAKDPLTKAVGILSDKQVNLQYLAGMPLANFAFEDENYNQAVAKQYDMTVFFDADTFPTSENVLNNFAALILDDVNTNALSEAQKTALSDWVKNGGLLVAGTGGNGGKLLTGLPLFADINQDGTRAVSGIMGVSEEVVLAELSGENLIVVKEEEGNPLVSHLGYGEGHILLPHFSLSLTPMANKQETVDFLKKIMKDPGEERFNLDEDMYRNPDFQRMIAQRFPALEMRSLYLVMGIAVLYILIAGPVLYIILKKKDKRELGWIIVPALSVVFLGLGLVAAQSSGYKSGMLRTAAYVAMDEGTTTATADVGIAFKSAGKGKVTFTSEDNLPVMITQDGWVNFGGIEQTKLLYRVRSGEGTEIVYPENTSWQTQYFSSKIAVDLGGSVESTVTLDEDGYKGEITNHTNVNFSNFVLMLGGREEQFGALGAGETVQVDIKIDEESDDFYNNGFYHSQIQIKVRNGELSRKEAFVMFNQAEMISNYYNNNGMQNIAIPVEFFGFSDEPLLTSGAYINGKALTESNQTVYHQQFAVNLAEMEEVTVLLRGTLTMDGKYNFHSDGDIDLLYGMDEGIMDGEVVYNLPKDVRIDSFVIPSHRQDTGYNQVEDLRLFNRKTGELDSISMAQSIDAADYIDESNQVTLHFSYQPQWETEVPKLQIKGGGIHAGN